MTTLGKILLVVNLLAAVAVGYYATATWSKRQGPNEQLAKYYLTIGGLAHESTGPAAPPGPPDPAEEIKLSAAAGGGIAIDHISRKALDAHFGGTAPVSRKAAVEELQKDKLGKLRGGAAATVLSELVGTVGADGRFDPGTLVLLSDSFDERQAYRDLLNDPMAAQANAAAAVDVLAAKFAAAVSPPTPTPAADPNTPGPLATARAKVQQASADLQQKLGDLKLKLNALDALTRATTAPTQQEMDDAKKAYNGAVEAAAKAERTVLDANGQFTRALTDQPKSAATEADRRRRVSALLLCVDRSAAGQKRAVLALGQRDYLTAVNDRLDRLGDMSRRYDREGEYATARFVLLYDQKRKAAQDLETLAVTQKTLADSLDGVVKKSTDLLAQRTTQRDDAKASAEAMERAVNAGVAEQAVLEGQLLDLQRKVGALLRDNYDLENQLRAKEQPTGGK